MGPPRCCCTGRSSSSRRSSRRSQAGGDQVSSETFGDFEGLLKRALTPVEPPADLSLRLESTLTELTELAQDELESWELTTMRDPRNWARPVAAVAIGTTAGAALVLL